MPNSAVTRKWAAGRRWSPTSSCAWASAPRSLRARRVECGAKPGTVAHVNTNAEAIGVLAAAIKSKSIILVKGSRGMKMEEIVAALGGGVGD